jgi:cytochrome c biogenesis protein CcmG/thiol:disulfide interchange protein DsbE
MKNLLIVLFLIPITLFSQIENKDTLLEKTIPEITLKDINGKSVNTKNLTHCGPIIISFWATWCSPCKKELNAFDEIYEELKETYGVKIVAVSIDDEKTKNSVPLYIRAKGFEFQILLDPNGDFKRLMGVNNIPHTFIINKEGKIVYSHNNYVPGDEENLIEELKKL